MGVCFSFDKNGISEKDVKEIRKYYIDKFLRDEFFDKEKRKCFILAYPFGLHLYLKDEGDLGLSIQFSMSLEFPPSIELMKKLDRIRNVKYVENGKKIEYEIKGGYGNSKAYYEKLKKHIEECILLTKNFFSDKSEEEKESQNYRSQLMVLNAFLEFAKTGIKYPKLVLHY
jgi:hypothetical protein